MYPCMYTCISIQTDKLIETISILLLTALCLYQHNWFVQKPLCPSVFSVCFAPGQLFSFCLGVGIVLGWTWLFFFFGGRRTNTSKTIFLLVIKFIKTHGIQLLTLRVTLSLDGCDRLSETCHSAEFTYLKKYQYGLPHIVSACKIPLKSLAVLLLLWFVGLQTKLGDQQGTCIHLQQFPTTAEAQYLWLFWPGCTTMITTMITRSYILGLSLCQTHLSTDLTMPQFIMD